MLRPVFAVGDKPREDERSCCASSKEGMRLRFRPDSRKPKIQADVRCLFAMDYLGERRPVLE